VIELVLYHLQANHNFSVNIQNYQPLILIYSLDQVYQRLLVIVVYHRWVLYNVHEQLSENRQTINDHQVFRLFKNMKN
jgi:hypothetical protein